MQNIIAVAIIAIATPATAAEQIELKVRNGPEAELSAGRRKSRPFSAARWVNVAADVRSSPASETPPCRRRHSVKVQFLRIHAILAAHREGYGGASRQAEQ